MPDVEPEFMFKSAQQFLKNRNSLFQNLTRVV